MTLSWPDVQVVEGGRQPVLRTHLDLATNGITELMYNVTRGPHHGRLDVMDVGVVTVLRKNTAYFSSRELMTERVFYAHDDSETRRDSFHFVALSSEEEDFQYVGVFHVDVLLKNDNTPIRAVDKVCPALQIISLYFKPFNIWMLSFFVMRLTAERLTGGTDER
jgi:chondroitin sulfate proteoglycan 4